MHASDILSAWTGFRPLLAKAAKSTASVPRGHQIKASDSLIVTVLGGKWTTCRAIAEDAVDFAIKLHQVRRVPKAPTPTQAPLTKTKRSLPDPLCPSVTNQLQPKISKDCQTETITVFGSQAYSPTDAAQLAKRLGLPQQVRV